MVQKFAAFKIYIGQYVLLINEVQYVTQGKLLFEIITAIWYTFDFRTQKICKFCRTMNRIFG